MKQFWDAFFEVFSTREIAVAFYSIIAIIACFISKNIRKSAKVLIETALTPKLIIPFVVIIVYSSVITYLYIQFSFWEWKYIKDVIVWTLFAGVPVCFKAVNSGGKEEGYFKNIILDNFKFSAIIEFFTGSFTFNLIFELIFQPFIIFLTLLECLAGRDKKNKTIQKVIQWLLAIIGLFIFIFTIKTAVKSLTLNTSEDLLVTFSIPIVYSILFVPASYLLAVYAKYEILFIRLKFKEPENNKLKYRIRIIFCCRLRLKRIILFQKHYVRRIYQTMDEQQYSKVIEDFIKEIKERDNHRKTI